MSVYILFTIFILFLFVYIFYMIYICLCCGPYSLTSSDVCSGFQWQEEAAAEAEAEPPARHLGPDGPRCWAYNHRGADAPRWPILVKSYMKSNNYMSALIYRGI